MRNIRPYLSDPVLFSPMPLKYTHNGNKQQTN